MKSVVRLAAIVALAPFAAGAPAEAQVVYYGALRPVVAAPVAVAPAYVANYTPAGNYAAVTAYSPPVFAEPTAIAVTSAYAPAVVAAPVGVTSYYAPTAVTSYYAPAAVAPTVSYYAPSVVPAPVVAAPVTAYYPGMLYRRGPLGVYRPVRSGYYIPY